MKACYTRTCKERCLETARRARPAMKTQDSVLDAVWLDEAERRLAAFREGRVQGIPAEDVIGKL